MATDKPHSRFEHVYVVLRIDDYMSVAALEDRISAVATFTTRQAAEQDAERLNELELRKGRSRYIVFPSRMKG